jgi:hypothetical protein
MPGQISVAINNAAGSAVTRMNTDLLGNATLQQTFGIEF